MGMDYSITLGPYIRTNRPVEHNAIFGAFGDRIFLPESHKCIVMPNREKYCTFSGGIHTGPEETEIYLNDIFTVMHKFNDDYKDVVEWLQVSYGAAHTIWGVVSYYH